MTSKNPLSLKKNATLKDAVLDLIAIRSEMLTSGVKGITDMLEIEDKLIAKIESRGYDAEALVTKAKELGLEPTGRKFVDMRVKTGSRPAWDAYRGDSDYLDTGTYKAPSKAAPRCAHTHPLLTFAEGQGAIQGGSCYSPQGTYDVEIALCGGAKTPSLLLPWGTQYARFPIQDQHPPSDKDTFDKLIDWTIAQMAAGKKVHVGCIGGHGRTGVFLAVLYQRLTGDDDAIVSLRQRYCKKAVESQRQVDWLHKHYGIKKAPPCHASTEARTTATSKFDRDRVRGVTFGLPPPKSEGGRKLGTAVPTTKAVSIW